MSLPQSAVAFYQENGYLIHRAPLFSHEEFNRLTAIFEEHLAAKGDKQSDELDTPHFQDDRLFEFLFHPNVVDVVSSLIGPAIGLFSSHFICKDPYTGRATPWHEDSSYWKDRFNRHDRIVTVWLAIDRSFRENGCMRVIPGTHRNGFSEYESVNPSVNTFGLQIRSLDESTAVDFELEPGQCSLHDARLIHGAAANTSPYRRCGYTMRYFATDHKLIPENNPKNWKMWLVSGIDRAGNHFVNA